MMYLHGFHAKQTTSSQILSIIAPVSKTQQSMHTYFLLLLAYVVSQKILPIRVNFSSPFVNTPSFSAWIYVPEEDQIKLLAIPISCLTLTADGCDIAFSGDVSAHWTIGATLYWTASENRAVQANDVPTTTTHYVEPELHHCASKVECLPRLRELLADDTVDINEKVILYSFVHSFIYSFIYVLIHLFIYFLFDFFP